ncbi:hypothetical protein M8J75_006258 [Diaphorina citri]|nr:hypothetical protein M8J75_006258 [Diaphorina citri]
MGSIFSPLFFGRCEAERNFLAAVYRGAVCSSYRYQFKLIIQQQHERRGRGHIKFCFSNSSDEEKKIGTLLSQALTGWRWANIRQQHSPLGQHSPVTPRSDNTT